MVDIVVSHFLIYILIIWTHASGHALQFCNIAKECICLKLSSKLGEGGSGKTGPVGEKSKYFHRIIACRPFQVERILFSKVKQTVKSGYVDADSRFNFCSI